MPNPVAEVVAYLREEADFNRSWTDGRRGPHFGADAGYIARRKEQANQRDNWANEIERLSRERDTGVPDGWREAIQRIRNTSMQQALAARVPECGHFGSIAQDADWIANEIAAAPQPPTVSTQGWQDISTALRDGTEILLWTEHGARVGYFETGHPIFGDFWFVPSERKPIGQMSRGDGFTHWMPLPGKPGEHPAPQPDLSALTRERDQAREALAPLAAWATILKSDAPDSDHLPSTVPHLSLTIGQARIAARALGMLHASDDPRFAVLHPEKEEKA